MNPEAAQVAYAAMAQNQVKSTLSMIINMFRKEEKKMEQYVRAEMEVVEFECEDVITTSGTDDCTLVGYAPDSDDSEFG